MSKAVLFVLTAAVVCNAGPLYHEDLFRQTGRIVGGSQTTIAKHPYQLSLMVDGSPFCGASIIGPQWAVTAAHCIFVPTNRISFRAGSTSKLNGGKVFQAASVIVHEKYVNSDYDIAVVKVNQSFPIGSDRIDKINLAASGLVLPDDSPVVVSGWGDLTSGGSSPEYLHEVSVNIVNRTRCKDMYNPLGTVTERMICAGVKAGGKDSCQGDSGGPLVYKNDTLVGIVSWGYRCAIAEFPGVYSNVANLRQWIKTKTGI